MGRLRWCVGVVVVFVDLGLSLLEGGRPADLGPGLRVEEDLVEEVLRASGLEDLWEGLEGLGAMVSRGCLVARHPERVEVHSEKSRGSHTELIV